MDAQDKRTVCLDIASKLIGAWIQRGLVFKRANGDVDQLNEEDLIKITVRFAERFQRYIEEGR